MHGLQVSHITVTRILFTTSGDATRLMGGVSTGMPDNAVVCYVEMRGSVTGQSTALLGQPVKGSHDEESTIRAVFDAHSGALLVTGLS